MLGAGPLRWLVLWAWEKQERSLWTRLRVAGHYLTH